MPVNSIFCPHCGAKQHKLSNQGQNQNQGYSIRHHYSYQSTNQNYNNGMNYQQGNQNNYNQNIPPRSNSFNNIDLSNLFKPLNQPTKLLILPSVMLIFYIWEFIHLAIYATGGSLANAEQAGASTFTIGDRMWVIFITVIFVLVWLLSLRESIWSQAISVFLAMCCISTLLGIVNQVEDGGTYFGYMLMAALVFFSRLHPQVVFKQYTGNYKIVRIWIARVLVGLSILLLLISIKYMFLILLPIIIFTAIILGATAVSEVMPRIAYGWTDALGFFHIIFMM